MQGVGLINEMEKRRDKGVISERTSTGDFRALTNPEGMKVLRDFGAAPLEAEAGPQGWTLVDSRNDYWEHESLDDRDLLDRLAAEYLSLHAESLRYRQAVEVDLTDLEERTIRQLKALGYLE